MGSLRVKIFENDDRRNLEFYVNKFLEGEDVRLKDITPLTVYFKYQGDNSEKSYCIALVYEKPETSEDEGSGEDTEE